MVSSSKLQKIERPPFVLFCLWGCHSWYYSVGLEPKGTRCGHCNERLAVHKLYQPGRGQLDRASRLGHRLPGADDPQDDVDDAYYAGTIKTRDFSEIYALRAAQEASKSRAAFNLGGMLDAVTQTQKPALGSGAAFDVGDMRKAVEDTKKPQLVFDPWSPSGVAEQGKTRAELDASLVFGGVDDCYWTARQEEGIDMPPVQSQASGQGWWQPDYCASPHEGDDDICIGCVHLLAGEFEVL